MVKMTWSFYNWLWMNGYKEIIPLIGFGHLELVTEDMYKEYLEWVQTDEGREYLKGGSKHKDVIGEEAKQCADSDGC